MIMTQTMEKVEVMALDLITLALPIVGLCFVCVHIICCYLDACNAQVKVWSMEVHLVCHIVSIHWYE